MESKYFKKTTNELEEIIINAKFALQVKEYKKENIVIETLEHKKFKKNEPLLIDRILRKWNQDFIDEDTGEVVTIERQEVLSVLVNNVAYNAWLLEYRKELNKYVMSYYSENKALNFFLNNKNKHNDKKN